MPHSKVDDNNAAVLHSKVDDYNAAVLHSKADDCNAVLHSKADDEGLPCTTSSTPSSCSPRSTTSMPRLV